MHANELFHKRPLNFAHRGFTKSAPENSLAAFKNAMELGVDGIELDIRTCKSGEIVVFHDSYLSRMTSGKGFIKNRRLSELKRQRLLFQKQETREQIPTLEEVIGLTKGKMFLNIEIKTNGLPGSNIEEKLVDLLYRCGVEREVIISSFNPLVVRRMKKIDATLLTGYLIDKKIKIKNTEIFLSKLTGAKAIHLEKSLAREALLKKMHEFGFYSMIWTVNEKSDMQSLINLNVNGIISDRPDLLKPLT